jgi:hypothetical protein
MRTLEEAPFLDPFGEEFQADPFGSVFSPVVVQR